MTKSYGTSSPVLRGISLKVEQGETIALIGPNGAGKSTLLKSLVGLHSITGGTVQALGQTLSASNDTAQREAVRRQIGFVFQSHSLVRRMSALSNVVHGLLGYPGSWRAWHQSIAPRDWRDRAMAALDSVRLSDKALTRADQLSGGQAQRVAIARSIVRHPRLLLADEPAASLDPAAGHDVMEQFAQLAKDRGITLLFTSHDMDHAKRYADRIIALKGGVIHFDRQNAELDRAELARVFDG